MFKKLGAYYALTKPGIIKGNAVHVLVGVFLASSLSVDVETLLGVLIGTSLVIASACVANNYMDRKIDAKMKRTRLRPSVTGFVPVKNAMIFASALGLLGFVFLVALTNGIVVSIGVIAYITYVFAYGWAKRRTIHSTLVGAVPGALPAMAGYIAVIGELSLSALLIFLLIFTWQMPHFYAISLFRKKEYKAANIPVLGVVRSFDVVRRYIFTYIFLYVAVISLLISFKVVGAPAGLLLLAGAAYWIGTFALTDTKDSEKWARTVFAASLVLTLVLLIASIMNVFVPPML